MHLTPVQMVGSGETVYFSVTAFGIASDYNVIVLPYAYPVAHSSSPDYSRMMELVRLDQVCAIPFRFFPFRSYDHQS
jgi:hypothetical protein